MMPNEPHALSIVARERLQLVIMLVGDDSISALASRFAALEKGWNALVPPDQANGKDSAKFQEMMRKDKPDLLRAWAGEQRKPTDAEKKDGNHTNVTVLLGWHLFVTKYRAGHATLAEFEAQIELANAMLDKYLPKAEKLEALSRDVVTLSEVVRGVRSVAGSVTAAGETGFQAAKEADERAGRAEAAAQAAEAAAASANARADDANQRAARAEAAAERASADVRALLASMPKTPSGPAQPSTNGG